MNFPKKITSIYGKAFVSVKNFSAFGKDSNLVRMIINSAWLGSATPISIMAGLLRAGLLARILGTTGMGIYGLIISLTSALSLIAGFTSAQALLTYANSYIQKNDKRTVAHIVNYCFLLDFLLSITAYTGLLLVAFNISSIFNVPETSRTALIVYGLSAIFQSTMMSSISVMQFCDCFRYDFLFQVLTSLALLSTVAVIFIVEGGLMAVIISEVIISFVAGLILLFIALRLLHAKGIYLKFSVHRWWKVPKEIWKFQLFGYLRGAVMGIHRHAGILILGYLTSPAEVGLYHAARRISEPIRNTSGIFSQSLYPTFGRLWFSNKYLEMKKLFQRSSFLLTALGFATCLILIPQTRSIISLIYGKQFINASSATSILLFCAAIAIIVVPLNTILPATGKNLAPLIATMIMAVIQVFLLLILIPPYGLVGAAYSLLGAFTVGNVFFLLPQTIMIIRKAKHRTK